MRHDLDQSASAPRSCAQEAQGKFPGIDAGRCAGRRAGLRRRLHVLPVQDRPARPAQRAVDARDQGNELVLQLPDGVYIESLKQQEQTVQIQGIAQSNERVSELLNSLATKTPWLSKPELVEVVGTTTQINTRERKRVAGFNLRFGLVRSSDVEQAHNAQALKK